MVRTELRMSDELHAALTDSARANRRSLNSELLVRLENSMEGERTMEWTTETPRDYGLWFTESAVHDPSDVAGEALRFPITVTDDWGTDPRLRLHRSWVLDGDPPERRSETPLREAVAHFARVFAEAANPTILQPGRDRFIARNAETGEEIAFRLVLDHERRRVLVREGAAE